MKRGSEQAKECFFYFVDIKSWMIVFIALIWMSGWITMNSEQLWLQTGCAGASTRTRLSFTHLEKSEYALFLIKCREFFFSDFISHSFIYKFFLCNQGQGYFLLPRIKRKIKTQWILLYCYNPLYKDVISNTQYSLELRTYETILKKLPKIFNSITVFNNSI